MAREHMMKYLKFFLYWFLDTVLTWFTPRWRRTGRETCAALRRYINHYRPQLGEKELSTCTELLQGLQGALRLWNKAETERLTKLADVQCSPMQGYKRHALVEMAESFFVIMVVFLGIRTYYAQPFRIPTGSMQPSLNGIIVHPVEEIPSAPKRIWDMITLGSSYIEATADAPKQLVKIHDRPKYLLFTETILTFSDGSTISIPSAKGAVIQYLKDQGKLKETPAGIVLGSFSAGEPIMRARVDAGDMIIVNRMSYHFRKPERGETFVFDTRGINTSMKSSAALRIEDQQAATHYIKRLCGLPGDTLQVRPPYLYVNGTPAKEHTIARVAEGKAPFNKCGYQELPFRRIPNAYMTDLAPVTLRNPEEVNLREYAALGDNTTNSLDSRYWGPVKQFNIVGPACLTVWPFTSHWGRIE